MIRDQMKLLNDMLPPWSLRNCLVTVKDSDSQQMFHVWICWETCFHMPAHM